MTVKSLFQWISQKLCFGCASIHLLASQERTIGVSAHQPFYNARESRVTGDEHTHKRWRELKRYDFPIPCSTSLYSQRQLLPINTQLKVGSLKGAFAFTSSGHNLTLPFFGKVPILQPCLYPTQRQMFVVVPFLSMRGLGQP